MGGGVKTGINTALAQPDLARPIVLLAKTPLDAVYAAGIRINEVEEEFLRKIPAAMWTDLRGHILAAYTNGHTPELDITPNNSYRFEPTRATDQGVVRLNLLGPVPSDASLA